MKKKGAGKILGLVLTVVCIAGSFQTLKITAAQESRIEITEDGESLEIDFSEPCGSVIPDEAIPITEEEAEEIHKLFQEQESLEAYSLPSVNSEFVSNYGYNTLTTQKEQACYAEVKSKALEFHQQKKEAVYRQTTDSSGNVTGGYYIWAEFFVSEYGLNVNQMQKVLFAVEADCPEFFWFSGSFGYAYNSNDIVTKVYPKIESGYIEAETRSKTQENIDAGIQPYLAAIDQAKAAGADQITVELLIHDMILEAVDYEYIPGTLTPQSASYAHSIAGLFEGTGVVCEGYAKGFQMLLTYAGIESIYAVGYGNGGGHAWNLVCLDGEWYNIDLTWNDVGRDGSYHDGIRYRYFNCSKEFFGNHVYMPNIFKGMYEVPETICETYNYYHYYGLYVAQEDVSGKDAFVKFMTNALKKAEGRNDYLMQFAFDSLDTRNSFAEYLKDYEKDFLACVNDGQNVYKVAGEGTYISGSPYNLFYPMLRIYADTYEVNYKEAGSELIFHMVKGRREVAQEGNYTVNYLQSDQTSEGQAVVCGMGDYDFIGENIFPFRIIGIPVPTEIPTPTVTVTCVPTVEPTAALTPDLRQVSGLKLVSASADTVKIQFTKQPQAEGYRVILYQGNKQKKTAITSQGSYTFQKLSAAADYTVKVQAYTTAGNAKFYGTPSKALKVITATKAPVIKSVKKGNKKAVVTWQKVSKAAGYELYMSSKKKGGYKKIATIKKAATVKYTRKNLKSGKTYYFKMRTYRQVGGKKVYSLYSKVKSRKL